MVHLQSVHIRGFKTFAKPTELVLEPGVTVIIGPNGSGKSNIADAVLWVLGEQSANNLRGRTMQDVIFSGADGKKQSSVAEVSLVFNNGCGTLPLDCSELEVTRRLTRDAGSEYRLNGSGCRLIDIQDVVGQLGLGREMHSVISQGRVESLLNSSAEFRRAMVEEAAGLGRFKKRRERAQTKLERATQNLVRARDIEDEVRAAMRPLRQQVAAAERHAEATEDWASAKGRLLLHSLLEVKDSYGASMAEMERIEKSLSDVGARVADLRRQRAAEEESLTVALKQRERVTGLFHRARGLAEYLEGRTAALRQRLARAEGDLDRARRRLEMALSDVSAYERRMAEVMTGTGDEVRLARVAAWSESLRGALQEAQPAYQNSAQKEDDLKDRVFELEAARARALQDRDFLRREKEERSRVLGELALLIDQAQQRVSQMKEESGRLESSSREAELAVQEAASSVVEADQHLQQVRGRAQEAARSEAGMAEMIAGLESRQAVLRAVLDRKEGLPAGAKDLLAQDAGYRLLTEALSVRPGFERAVATALGPIVQAVVIPAGGGLRDALQATKGPVEVLGPASKGGSTLGEMKAPDGSLDLWELIDGPSELIASLRSLVPQTFVVEDADQTESAARALESAAAGSDLRMVSRSGELLHGGVYAARRSESAAESLLAAANELEAAVEEYDDLCKRRIEAAAAAERAAAEAQAAEEGLREKENQVRQAEHLLAAGRSEADLYRRRLEENAVQLNELRDREQREKRLGEELSGQLAGVEEAMAAGESDLNQAREELRALQASLEGLRKNVARLEEKRGQCTLVEVKLRERCRNLAAERSRVQGQKQIADRESEKWGQRVKFLELYGPGISRLLSTAERLGERGRSLAEGLERAMDSTRDETEGSARSMRDWGGAETDLQREYDSLTIRMADIRVEQARLEDRRTQLEQESAELRRRHLSPREIKPEDVVGADPDALSAAVERAERRRERIGPVNPLAEQEYGQMAERAQFLAEQRQDLEAAVAELDEVISSLDDHIERSFHEVFQAAKENFEAVIPVVFPGAKGSLRLTEARQRLQSVPSDEEVTAGDAVEEEQEKTPKGVDIEVRFANKAPRSLGLLSGGEKAMTAIAFLFSLFLAKPCPFYILDEVEASLDDINIRRFLSLVKRYRERTQFIIITHQRQTMEVADTLYGVALESDGTSRVLSRKMTAAKGA